MRNTGQLDMHRHHTETRRTSDWHTILPLLPRRPTDSYAKSIIAIPVCTFSVWASKLTATLRSYALGIACIEDASLLAWIESSTCSDCESMLFLPFATNILPFTESFFVLAPVRGKVNRNTFSALEVL